MAKLKIEWYLKESYIGTKEYLWK